MTKSVTFICVFICACIQVTAQIETESVSTEKPFKIEYDSSVNIPDILPNLIGQSFYVLPIKTSKANDGYSDFYSKPNGTKHYLAESQFGRTPQKSISGKTFAIIGCKKTNKGKLLMYIALIRAAVCCKLQGDGIWSSRSQLLEQIMHASVARVIRGGIIPLN